jgi:putative glycero-phosphotransferase
MEFFAFIRFSLKIGMLILLFPLRIFSVKRNRILLLENILNFDAQYNSNTKYISEYLLKNYPNVFEIVYPLGKKRDFSIFKGKSVTPVKLGSFKYYYYVMTSKFFITTSGAIAYIPFRKKQIVINTWHGGGAYKKMGLDTTNNFFYKLDCKLTAKKTSYFLSSNKYFSNVVNSSLLISYNKFLNIGLPRNDIFFKDYSNIAKKVKNHYKIDENKKIIMYAPTYRPFKGNPFFLKHELGPYEIDTELILEELKKKFSGEWVFVLRLHPSIAELIQKNSNEKVINVSDYDDIQELMCASDILINDYSSTMWDFVQTKKPCFIFAKDLDEYENSTGLYTQPSSWPFPLARNNQEFVENIRIFDNEKYLKDVEYYFNWMENYETGMACKQLCEMIYNIWKEENK